MYAKALLQQKKKGGGEEGERIQDMQKVPAAMLYQHLIFSVPVFIFYFCLSLPLLCCYLVPQEGEDEALAV